MAFFGFVKFGVFSREEPYYVDGHGSDKISVINIISKIKRTNLKKLMYRPRQPNWEHTIGIFQYFSATQVLRETNFGHFEAPKLL